MVEVVDVGGHPMQVVQVEQVELFSKELGEVAEEVLTGCCSGSALVVEVEAVVLKM